MAEWQLQNPAEPPLVISVNVSARQLSDPRLVEDVELALAESGLRHESLALEMTESSIMGDAEQTLDALNRLKRMNIRLEIDDFGTGYSSLSYLQRLPFDILKIDRSFVNELGVGDGSRSIVKAILELGHSFGMEVIAEGVETDLQLISLRQLGCIYIQGYLFSRPLDADAANRFYRKSRETGLTLRT
jgi:EAL domain-containing protein (putative c-di-GMP-specific phosphodiesterase class I)